MSSMKNLNSLTGIIKETLPILLGVMIFNVLTGLYLEQTAELIFVTYPFLIIGIPALVNVAGDMADVFLARITSALFTGRIRIGFKPYSLSFVNFFGTYAVACSGYLFLSFILYLMDVIIFHGTVSFFQVVLVFLLAGTVAFVVSSGVGLTIAHVVYLKGLNPDNFTPPITTSLGDVVGTVSLLFFALTLL